MVIMVGPSEGDVSYPNLYLFLDSINLILVSLILEYSNALLHPITVVCAPVSKHTPSEVV